MIVRVVYHRSPDFWWADSEQLPDWVAAAKTLSALKTRVDANLTVAQSDNIVVQHVLSPPALEDIAEVVAPVLTPVSEWAQGWRARMGYTEPRAA